MPRYNPLTGSRLDLEVYDEPEADAAARWAAKRREYLKVLLDDPHASPFARVVYKRELAKLEPTTCGISSSLNSNTRRTRKRKT